MTKHMTSFRIAAALSMSVAVPAVAIFLGVGSAAAAEQNPAAYHARNTHYRYQGGIAPGTYGYAPGYGSAPCFGINCGLPGGHPGSDYFKPGNGDHGNDGGNGG